MSDKKSVFHKMAELEGRPEIEADLELANANLKNMQAQIKKLESENQALRSRLSGMTQIIKTFEE